LRTRSTLMAASCRAAGCVRKEDMMALFQGFLISASPQNSQQLGPNPACHLR
jgi:hypothetical protein